MKDWLSTSEAALMLRVSEASVRRWSDAGLLPVDRVGRRGERRFQESDVRYFLEQGLQGGAPAREPATRAVVMLGGVAVPLGGHVATFYDSDAARFRLTIPFLSEGLRQGQACMLLASNKLQRAYLEELGAQHAVDLDGAISSGILVTANGLGPTLDDASLRWQELAWSALRRSSGILRVVGEMSWAATALSGSSDLARFEDGLNSVVKRFPAVVVCQYDAREFDGIAVLGAMKTHPDIFELHLGTLIA